jgi:glutamine amidotransferase
MCRLLAVYSAEPIDVSHHLGAFSRLCADSREYQGHGWGCAVWRESRWDVYRTVRPIWEDDFRPAGEVRVLLAHARSAFRDRDIAVENNMPFVNERRAFLFNGELRGVHLATPGRTGAHKLFRLLCNFGEKPLEECVRDVMALVRRRTDHIRACNLILADATQICVHSLFNGEEEYFTMHWKAAPRELVICSERYPGEHDGWQALPNGGVRRFECSF